MKLENLGMLFPSQKPIFEEVNFVFIGYTPFMFHDDGFEVSSVDDASI